MKKILFFIFSLAILSSVALGFYHFFIGSKALGALQVTSSPKSKVYLNGELYGETPLCLCPESVGGEGNGKMLPVGEYTIRMVSDAKTFPEFQEKIRIEKSVLTVVDRTFGEGASSEAIVVSLSPLASTDDNELVVMTVPDKADVMLDAVEIGRSPVTKTNTPESDHTLTIQKLGYKEKTIEVRTTNKYRLTVKAFLGIDPTFSTKKDEASVSPTPSLTVTTVTILQTGTGFLRVRDEPSLGGTEIDQVTPGESYTLVSEEQGWYEIQVNDDTTGWISAEFAAKEE